MQQEVIDKKQAQLLRAAVPGPTRTRTAITWALLCIWVLLAAFGIVSGVSPNFLKSARQAGAMVEAIDAKNLADVSLRQGKPLLAIAQYQGALRIDPDHGPARVNLAAAWIQVGQPGRATPLLLESLERTRSDVTRAFVYSNLGDLAETQGKREESIDFYARAAEVGTDRGRRYVKLGQALLASERFTEALAAFESAVAHMTDPASSYRDMLARDLDVYTEDPEQTARILEDLEAEIGVEDLARYDIETIRRTYSVDPAVAGAHNYAGWALIRLNRFGEAKRHFERSLEILPGNRNAEENLRVLRQIEEDARAANAR